MKTLPLMLALCLALAGCATYEQTNAAVRGGAIGAAAGAIISDNPVQGAVVGGALGAAAGAVLSDPNRQGGRGNYQGNRGQYHRDNGKHKGEYKCKGNSEHCRNYRYNNGYNNEDRRGD